MTHSEGKQLKEAVPQLLETLGMILSEQECCPTTAAKLTWNSMAATVLLTNVKVTAKWSEFLPLKAWGLFVPCCGDYSCHRVKICISVLFNCLYLKGMCRLLTWSLILPIMDLSYFVYYLHLLQGGIVYALCTFLHFISASQLSP